MPFDHLELRSDLLAIARGEVSNYSLLHKFGYTESVGTTLAPVTFGTAYQMPTSPVSVEVVSDNASDTSAGSGGRELTIQYLNSAWVEQTAVVNMNGASASSTVPDVMRIFRAYVSKAGSQATQNMASHFGNIRIREAGAGAQWALIPTLADSFGAGQTLISAYTVPAGKTAYMLSQLINVDSNKSIDAFFFKRESANISTAPYSALRIQNINVGIKDSLFRQHSTAEAYPEKTDLFYMAKASVSGDISCEFELLLVGT